jgi:hypothetical protein
MSTYSTVPAVVNPEVNRDVDQIIARSQAAAAELDKAYKQLADELAALVSRMYAAMDQVAEATGAYKCDYCGSYTLETIEVAAYSDEMGHESELHCPRCVPAGYREVA